jgi:hypothetical protein
MPTNLNPELLQEAIALDTTASIETVIETALRQYIDQCNRLKVNGNAQNFGESILAFREQHNISEMDIDPDEIWGDVRDRNCIDPTSDLRHITIHEASSLY